MSKPETTNSDKKSAPCTALILGGGGARAAYQVGVLKAISEIAPQGCDNPFPIICGTSAGSINTVAMASYASDFHLGVQKVIEVWSNFQLSHVFHSDAKNLAKRMLSWFWTHIGFGDWHKGPPSLLDNQPLNSLLSNAISYERIDKAIQQGDLHAYCLTACSYTTGESTTFFDGHASVQPWERTHRKGIRAKMNIGHLMASSAIPVVFPSIRLGDEYFGDGSMRQTSPISPAVHMGARKILIVGLRHEPSIGSKPKHQELLRPTLGQISGYVLDTLFMNSLFADIERMERINRVLAQQGPDQTGRLRSMQHLIISPSADIANIALKYYKGLPRSFRIALSVLGLNRGNSRRFISYLMFTQEFCRELIDLGYRDAMAQKTEIKEFLTT